MIANLVILYLIGFIYSVKSDLEYERIIKEDIINKLDYLDIGSEYYNDEDEDQVFKEFNNSLFDNDKQLIFLKEVIAKTNNDTEGIKDIYFLLKYKRKNEQKDFDIFFNNCKNIKDNLILMKNKQGNKFAIFSKNLYEILHGTISRDSIEKPNNFCIYSFNIDDAFEYSFKKKYEIYTSFIQCISNWLSEEQANILKKFDSYEKNVYGKIIFENIEEMEIYQVKYIK